MALERTISLSQFDQHFARLGTLSFRPALERCKLAILASIQENFDRGAGPDGTPWPALKFPRPNGGDRPLRDFGFLLASATVSSAQGHEETVTDKSLEVGTNLEYAKLQHDGGTVRATRTKFLAIPKTKEAKRAGSPRRFPGDLHFRGNDRGGGLFDAIEGQMQYALTKEVKIPPRPFIGWNPELEQECEDILADFVASQV